jgi:Lysozyme like domain
MSPVLILIGIILALGVWGYVQKGDVFYIVNKLSASDIATYAANAGFTGDNLVTAVAIALAESSGDPSAVGDQGTSIGLWQIHFTVHPEFDQNQLTDPQYNANAAFSVYQKAGNSFQPWSTFSVNQAYLNYLSVAQAAVSG